MREAASNLEFEEAARLRDEIRRLEAIDLGLREAPLEIALARQPRRRPRRRRGP